MLGLLIVLLYTCIGALLLLASEGGSRILGLLLVLTGGAWLVVDVLRRRGAV